MPSTPSAATGPLWLDLANERLWCGNQTLPLRPKTFALLRYLVDHPGQLLTKATLLEALWPDTIVSEVVLSGCVRELRQALGDDARQPRFIETMHRRGYRFIGHLPTAPLTAPTPPAPLCRTLSPLLPGRQSALEALHEALATALTGTRQLLFVTGEAGLGKTTLIDVFLSTVQCQGPLWVGRGQCLDHYGAGEAYLPILEALERLCRGPEGQDIIEILQHQAPTWLVQMPGLISAAELAGLQRRVQGSTPERMLREMAVALTVLTATRPLILVLEDLHWSDYATLDLLVALARHRDAARLLVLGTYRPPDVLQRGHPLRTVQHDLALHGHCMELALTPLTAAAVKDYLAACFPDLPHATTLAHVVHQRTEGNPLFMVTVVEDWVRRGWLARGNVGWHLHVGLTVLAGSVPESLRQMLEQQLDRFSPSERRVLAVGSVAGAVFSAAALAAALEEEVIHVEEWCTGLARRQQWLEEDGEQQWPDGTVAQRYRFTHALYQEIAYSRLTTAQRLEMHRRIGARLESGYGALVGDLAAELAMHFERGRDARRALLYLRQAADKAQQRYAHTEAIHYLQRGLVVLATLPDTAERATQELDWQAALGPALMAVKGYAAPEVVHSYTRAYDLCQQVGDTAQHFDVCKGLCIFYQEKAALQTAHTLAEQLVHLAQRLQDPLRLLWAHNMLGYTLFYMGELVQARAHLEESLALYVTHTPCSDGSVFDPGVDTLCGLAEILYLLGYPDQALTRSQQALALARQLSHPFSVACALSFAVRLHRWRGEHADAQALAAARIALCHEQGFAQEVAEEMVWHGEAMVRQGQVEAGLLHMRQGLEALRATGAEARRPWLLTILAVAYGKAGQEEAGLAVLDEALGIVERTGKRLDEAGLYRRKGELLLQYSQRQQWLAAETCFQRSLAVARQQQAKSFELRAAMNLARLWQQQGKGTAAYDHLAPLYGWFTEGFDTADLQEARTLLAALER